MDEAFRGRKWPWEPERDRRILFALGWMAVGGVVTVLGGAFLMFGGLMVGVATGFVPDYKAVPGEELSWRTLHFLEERHLIEEGETLVYFDSVSTFSDSGDGSFFTDRRVVRYHEDPAEESGLFTRSLDYADIASIDPVFGHGSEAMTVIRIRPKEGEAFDLLVGNEEGGDRAFAEQLLETWNDHQVPGGTEETKK